MAASALVDAGSSDIPAFLRRDVSGASLRGVAIGASGSRPLSSDSLLRLSAGGAVLSPAAAAASFLSLAPRAVSAATPVDANAGFATSRSRAEKSRAER